MRCPRKHKSVQHLSYLGIAWCEYCGAFGVRRVNDLGINVWEWEFPKMLKGRPRKK